MANRELFRRTVLLLALSGSSAPWAATQAQEIDGARHPGRIHHGSKAAHPATRGVLAARPGVVRGLTISRPPQATGSGFGDADDIYVDGPIRYNSIGTFNPAPYADSGRQFPFGLDGIGGYGSDLGFAAGPDAQIYDRGP